MEKHHGYDANIADFKQNFLEIYNHCLKYDLG